MKKFLEHDLERIISCPLCGNSNFQPKFLSQDHFTGESFHLEMCSNCGLIFTNPRPNDRNLSKYYPQEYYGRKGKKFHPFLERIVHFCRKQLANEITSRIEYPGSILEIGAGRGILLSEMAQNGWITFGTEYSPNLTKELTDSRGLTIYPTPNLEDCIFPDKHFDVIVCFHVLEHLPDPIQTLFEISRILKPTGYLVIAVPNIGGIIARLSRDVWFGIDVPRHLFHFTPESLTRSLRKSGFVIETKTTLSIEQDIFGFTQSMMNLMGFSFNSFYDLIRSPEGRMKYKFNDTQKFRRFYQESILLITGSILSIIGLPITWIVSILGLGGTITYWSRPAS